MEVGPPGSPSRRRTQTAAVSCRSRAGVGSDCGKGPLQRVRYATRRRTWRERARRGDRDEAIPVMRASSACSRSSQISRTARPSSVGAASNRSTAASASATSPPAPRSSSVSTRTPVAGTPHDSSCPERTRWSTAPRAHGDDAGYRDYRDRGRAMATSLAFDGHIAWAEAMP
jgi:hypothetical protein